MLNQEICHHLNSRYKHENIWTKIDEQKSGKVPNLKLLFIEKHPMRDMVPLKIKYLNSIKSFQKNQKLIAIASSTNLTYTTVDILT